MKKISDLNVKNKNEVIQSLICINQILKDSEYSGEIEIDNNIVTFWKPKIIDGKIEPYSYVADRYKINKLDDGDVE